GDGPPGGRVAHAHRPAEARGPPGGDHPLPLHPDQAGGGAGGGPPPPVTGRVTPPVLDTAVAWRHLAFPASIAATFWGAFWSAGDQFRAAERVGSGGDAAAEDPVAAVEDDALAGRDPALGLGEHDGPAVAGGGHRRAVGA